MPHDCNPPDRSGWRAPAESQHMGATPAGAGQASRRLFARTVSWTQPINLRSETRLAVTGAITPLRNASVPLNASSVPQLLSRASQLTLKRCLLAHRPPWAVLRAASSGLEVRPAGGDAAPSRMSRRPPRCTHQVCTAQCGKGGVPAASYHHGYYRRTPQATHGHYLSRKDMAATQRHNQRQRQR